MVIAVTSLTVCSAIWIARVQLEQYWILRPTCSDKLVSTWKDSTREPKLSNVKHGNILATITSYASLDAEVKLASGYLPNGILIGGRATRPHDAS